MIPNNCLFSWQTSILYHKELMKKTLKKNFSGVSGENEGQARDKAANRLGLSGTSAEKAEKVIDEIDNLEATGESQKAEALRDVLLIAYPLKYIPVFHFSQLFA